MEHELTINYIDNPQESAWGIIGRGVGSFNKEQAGDNQFQRLCYVLQTSTQEIVGGVLAEVYFGWLYIDLLWVKEDLRGRGYGTRLMTEVEDQARTLGAKKSYLDTFSFQAPDFYRDIGYQVFGELSDFPKGYQRYFMSKQL
jgi:GNAT superfamily N-acetyltransferase